MHANRLRSLWDMLLTYARAFSVVCSSLEFSRVQLAEHLAMQGEEMRGTAALDPGHNIIVTLAETLTSAKNIISQIPALALLEHQIVRLEARSSQNVAAIYLLADIESLEHAIHDQLRNHFYYHVPLEYVPYYVSELPFGEDVFEAFPSAQKNIENAGKCLALGQGTASVFHLMRVMEAGLRALAKALDVQYMPSWEAYLTKIEKCIDEPHKNKSSAWKRKEPFYREIAGDLSKVKFAWRNPTMHIERDYEPWEAEEIYKAVRTFTQRLATKVRERRRKRSDSEGSAGAAEA